jgi:glycosyltransferase involved in cell wall biosynthesis
MNTGVQRMVRGIYRGLKATEPSQPLIWDNSWKFYCSLSPGEMNFLENPFQKNSEASAEPERLASPFPWSKTARWIKHRLNRLSLSNAKSDDLLFVPEIFQDHRLDFFSQAKLKRIAIFHDAIVLKMPDSAPLERKKTFEAYIRNLATFDKVICVSHEAESDLKYYWNEFGLKAPKTSVLGWPTDFSPLKRTNNSNFGSKQILCVGTFEPRKNHLRLLGACEHLWSEGLDFELVLIGRTTARFGDNVIRGIENLLQRNRKVRWLQHVDDQTLHRAYRDCSFTVFPSMREGFGLPIAESLWHHRPCVCGNNGALGEISEGEGCEIVNQQDTASLAEGIRNLLTDEKKYLARFQEAKQRTFASWKQYTELLLKEFEL